jgi:hypothetical protein
LELIVATKLGPNEVRGMTLRGLVKLMEKAVEREKMLAQLSMAGGVGRLFS